MTDNFIGQGRTEPGLKRLTRSQLQADIYGFLQIEADPLLIAERIVEQCRNYSVCPLLFNAGAWYVGARSFELLLESL